MNFMDVLTSIGRGDADFCCLCFKQIDSHAICNDDEIYIDNNMTEYMSQIIFTIFGETMDNLTSTFGLYCKFCKTSAVNTYTFIKSCQKKCKDFDKALESINDCLSDVLDPEFQDTLDFQTFFIVLDTDEFTAQGFYDNRKLYNTTSASKHLNRVLKATHAVEVKKKNVSEYKIKSIICSENKRANATLYDIPTIHTAALCDKHSEEYKCKECKKKFEQEENLRLHYFKQHYPRKFSCNTCSETFITKELMAMHEDRNHSTGVCIECGKHFSSKIKLEKHEIGHSLSIECKECGRKYRSRAAFRKHIADEVCSHQSRKDSRYGVYQCDYCKKRFWNKPYLVKHIQHEHENAVGYVCKYCNKKFYTPSRLQTHIVKHTMERNFVCTFCDGKFGTKASLLYHTRLHTGERPYQCEYCDLSFLSASRRLDHTRRHHLPPSLECEMCHIKFKSSISLLRHRKRHLNPNSRLHRFCTKEHTITTV